MKTFQEEQKRLRQLDKQDTERQITESAINAWLQQRRDIVDCVANRQVILDYMAGTEIRAASHLEEIYQRHDELRKSLVHQTEDEERSRLQEQITALLRPAMSPTGLAGEVKLMRFKSLAELRSKLANLERRGELQARTAAQVWREALEEAGCSVSNLPAGWEQMTPAELRNRATVAQPSRFQPVPAIWRTKSMMQTLSAKELRALIKTCGLEQINQILNQTPAEEQEAARGEA